MFQLSLGLLIAALLSRVDVEAGHDSVKRASRRLWSLHRPEAQPSFSELGFLSAAPGVMREGPRLRSSCWGVREPGHLGFGGGLPKGGRVRAKALQANAAKTTVGPNKGYKRDMGQGALVSDKWTTFKHSPPEDRRAASEPIGRVFGLKVLLVGKPCSGKGTQAPLLARKYRMVHLSTGNILRAEIQAETELGLIAKEQMEKGELLPDELMIALVKKRLALEDCQRNGWMLDGFPRTLQQARLMQRAGIVPDVVLELDRPDELVREWCLGRYHDAATGIIYHPKFNPPPPEVAPRLIWRTDDMPEVLERRLQLYQDKTRPLLDLYEGQVHRVDTARNELEVFADISKILDEVGERKLDATLGQDGDEEEALRALDPDVPVPSRPSNRASRDSLRHAVSRCNVYDMDHFLPVFVDCPPTSRRPRELVGYVSKAFASELSLLSQGSGMEVVQDSHVTLAPGITTPDARSRVMDDLVQALVSHGLLPPHKIRHEAQCVRSMLSPNFTSDPLLQLERGAMTLFGVPSHGVHINGFVRTPINTTTTTTTTTTNDTGTGECLSVWVGKRSSSKATYPGLLDVLAAGGQPSGLSFRANAFKECEEEASIPRSLLETRLKSAGMISYRYETSKGSLSTKLLHMYDLELPCDFIPYNGDGEVEAFTLMPVTHALESIQADLTAWKPNAALTVLDFAIRHGVLDGDHPDYIEISHWLRGAFMARPTSSSGSSSPSTGKQEAQA